MEIRLANLRDLKACLAIDDAYETEYVWQMEEQNRPGNVALTFRVARLPRPMRVTRTIEPDAVIRNFQSGGLLLVAEEFGNICGFVDVTSQAWNQSAWINNLAVSPAYRRKGVGTRLLRAALDWGREQNLRVALLDTSTKDYPAISLYQKQGFAFCGFNDQLYPNRDIALFFSSSLR
jgi:ribosomal protein S18 acetylase RimI-like enzyme